MTGTVVVNFVFILMDYIKKIDNTTYINTNGLFHEVFQINDIAKQEP